MSLWLYVDCCGSLAESCAVSDVVFLALVMFSMHVSWSEQTFQPDHLLRGGREPT